MFNHFKSKLTHIPIWKRFNSSNCRNAWEIIPQNLKEIGSKVVIVTRNEATQKEMGRRVWYELQKYGIESNAVVMQTPFPVASNIAESVHIYNIMFATSIITIGDAAVSDFGKAMCTRIESKLNDLTKRPKLFCFATTPSPHHYSNSFQILHHEDDILVQVNRPLAPDFVGIDPQIAALVPYPTINLVQIYLFSYLVDTILFYSYQALKESSDDISGTISQEIFEYLKTKNLELNFLSNDIKDLKQFNQINNIESKAAYILNELRTLFALKFNAYNEEWPGLLESTIMLGALDVGADKSLPYMYHSAKAMAGLHYVLENPDNYYRETDKHLLSALEVAYNTSLKILNQDKDQILKISKHALEDIETLLSKKPKLFTKQYKSKGLDALTPAGHIEKLLIPLEVQLEDPLIQNKISLQMKQKLLSSDVMLDIMEKVSQ